MELVSNGWLMKLTEIIWVIYYYASDMLDLHFKKETVKSTSAKILFIEYRFSNPGQEGRYSTLDFTEDKHTYIQILI